MIKFQGRSSLKQYMPLKPVKCAKWLFPKVRGVFWKGDSVEKGLGATVVKSLFSELHKKHHNVFFDNYFTSISLLEDLLKDGVYACDKAKDRKGFPDEVKQAKLKQV